jgi:hypothetical protein
MDTVATAWFRFVGANIRGTPSMKFWRVAHDLRVLQANAHILAVQEFRWPWYWRAAAKILRRKAPEGREWASSPGFRRGRGRPVRSATAVMWRGHRFTRRGTRVMLMHEGEAKVSEARFMRAVLLEDDGTMLAAWAVSGHAVVNGDQDGDPDLRRAMLAEDLTTLDAMMMLLRRTGYPGMAQMDLNIRPGGWAYLRLRDILRRHGCTLHGPVRGVEYLWTWDGRDSVVEVDKDFQIPAKNLHTDHEGRGIRARIVARRG